jgi:hypothetical protein
MRYKQNQDNKVSLFQTTSSGSEKAESRGGNSAARTKCYLHRKRKKSGKILNMIELQGRKKAT